MNRLRHKTNMIMLIAGMILITLQTTAAPDYAREQRWSDEVVPSLIVGAPIYLTQKNQHKFLGILAENNHSKMAVVVVHGMGLHPNWGMIAILRQHLFDHGYTTLSIQMPILAADASYKAYPKLFPDAVERLQLAVYYLKQKGYQRVAIVSHSNGSRMSRLYMASNPTDIDAWAALSLTQGDNFAGINIPVLDLYGDNDLPHVLTSTTKRKDSFKNKLSQQKVIADADHFFNGQEESMLQAVQEFLDGI